MKEHFKKLFVLFLMAVLFGCATAYKGIFKPNVIEPAIEKLVFVRTEGKVERDVWEIVKGKREIVSKEFSDVINGMAFPLGDGYILVLTHASKTKEMLWVSTRRGMVPIPQKIISEKHFIGKEEIKLIGRYNDISLFRSNLKSEIPFPFGDSDKVKLGTIVVIIGWSFNRGINVKDGIISKINLGKVYGETVEHSFLINVPVNPGDSGGLMLVYKSDGSGLEIIGVVNARARNAKGMGYALKSNYIKKAIDMILWLEDDGS